MAMLPNYIREVIEDASYPDWGFDDYLPSFLTNAKTVPQISP
jgi:hypothetical protein